MKFSATRYNIILLAAGASRRMGSPKQLLQYKGKSLLHHAIDTAIDAALGSVILTLGANAASLQKELQQKDILQVLNPDWHSGIASSISKGLQTAIAHNPELEGIIFMVCDQPFVQASLLQQLLQKHQATQQTIIASQYQNTMGTPVFFHRTFFPELLQLKGDTGAKKLIYKYPDALECVPFEAGHLDIDTPLDYEGLLGMG